MNRKLNTLLALAAAALTLVGCDNDNNNTDPTPTEGSLIIKADKEEVFADGKEVVTFTVFDAEGNELTSTDPRPVRIVEVESQKSLGNMNFQASSYENRTTEYEALYGTMKSSNTVTVNFTGRERIEKYYQRVLLVDITGTWCIACPNMAKALDNFSPDIKERTVTLAVHVPSDYGDPFLPINNQRIGDKILINFGSNSVPSLIFRNDFLTNNTTQSSIINKVKDYLVNSPVQCGLKVGSSSFDGDKVEFEVSIAAEHADSYDIAWAVVANNLFLPYPEGTIEDGIYNHVVVATSDNFFRYDKDTAIELGAGEEATRTFSVSGLADSFLPDDFNAEEDLHIAVWANRVVDDLTYTDNATMCPVGQSLDYKLN